MKDSNPTTLEDLCAKYKIGQPDSEYMLLISKWPTGRSGGIDGIEQVDVASEPLTEHALAERYGAGDYVVGAVLDGDVHSDVDVHVEANFMVDGDGEVVARADIARLKNLVEGVHEALWDKDHRGEDVEEMALRVKRERDAARAMLKGIGAPIPTVPPTLHETDILRAAGAAVRDQVDREVMQDMQKHQDGAKYDVPNVDWCALGARFRARAEMDAYKYKYASTRSSANEDAARDFDGFDPDEELQRFRGAIEDQSFEDAAWLAFNLDEWMTRGGTKPREWENAFKHSALVEIANSTDEYKTWATAQRGIDPDATSYAIPKRLIVSAADDIDPGVLDDDGLRTALGDPRLGPASPLRDRVQDAFERLLRERDAAIPRSFQVDQRFQIDPATSQLLDRAIRDLRHEIENTNSRAMSIGVANRFNSIDSLWRGLRSGLPTAEPQTSAFAWDGSDYRSGVNSGIRRAQAAARLCAAVNEKPYASGALFDALSDIEAAWGKAIECGQVQAPAEYTKLARPLYVPMRQGFETITDHAGRVFDLGDPRKHAAARASADLDFYVAVFRKRDVTLSSEWMLHKVFDPQAIPEILANHPAWEFVCYEHVHRLNTPTAGKLYRVAATKIPETPPESQSSQSLQARFANALSEGVYDAVITNTTRGLTKAGLNKLAVYFAFTEQPHIGRTIYHDYPTDPGPDQGENLRAAWHMRRLLQATGFERPISFDSDRMLHGKDVRLTIALDFNGANRVMDVLPAKTAMPEVPIAVAAAGIPGLSWEKGSTGVGCFVARVYSAGTGMWNFDAAFEILRRDNGDTAHAGCRISQNYAVQHYQLADPSHVPFLHMMNEKVYYRVRRLYEAAGLRQPGDRCHGLAEYSTEALAGKIVRIHVEYVDARSCYIVNGYSPETP